MRAVHKDVPEIFKPYEWIVRETAYSKETNRNNETIFSIGNGYIGVRGFFEEGLYFDDQEQSERATLINGVYEYYDFHHIWRRTGFPKRYHSISNHADPFQLGIVHAGERVSLAGDVREYERVLDMRDGTVTRSFLYTFSDGKEVRVRFERFADQCCKNAVQLRLTVVPSEDMEITLENRLDGLPADRCSRACTVYSCNEAGADNGALYVRYTTKRSGISVVCMSRDRLSVAGEACTRAQGSCAEKTYRLNARKGEAVVYERTVVYVTSLEIQTDRLKAEAQALSEEVFALGYEESKRRTTEAWKSFWQFSDIRIDGDLSVQQGIRFALFMLNQSCGKDGRTNISANGLTGSGYDGWTFWDTEIFMMPMLLYSQPQTVRKLLEYRYSILGKAKERAVEVDGEGTKGALYSWQSTNGEECAHLYECAPGQIHINPDICFAIKRYLEATGDYDFMEKYGAEILFETSIYMAHRGSFIPLKGNRFCFNVVCGPDEYSPAVDNNTYTNWLTRKQFYFALEIYDYLERHKPERLRSLVEKCGFDERERELIRRAADNMYIGYNEELGIYTQDDQFLYRDPIDLDSIPKEKLPLLFSMHPLNLWRYQVCKQADLVLLIYLCSDEFTQEMKRRIFDFYEPRTIHDSSLSAGIHSIVACDIGYYGEAYGYLKQSARMDLDNVNRNTYFGIHSANMGNTYQILVNGFAGMRMTDGELSFKPYLPEQWRSYSFTIRLRQSVFQVTVDKAGCRFELVSGKPLTVCLNGEAVLIQ